MKSHVIAIAMLAALGSLPDIVRAQDMIPGRGSGPRAHDMKHPSGEQQRAVKQEAQAVRLRGRGAGRVQELGYPGKGKPRFVELEQTRSDRIFVVLAEFGTAISQFGGTSGPVHNEIAEPDRTTDNVTIWQPDYDRPHFEGMYFTQMREYYRLQSSGRYSFTGGVVDWVRVPFNEARYGTNACLSNVCSSVWALIRDAINIWTANQLAAGRTTAEVKAELDSFDVWDRYDYDGDGNFDEPDGYIDHFQIVHAGEGEETGGGAQGADAIWSHRWFAFFNLAGSAGPAFNRNGGTQFGATGMWVGDYTMQPENGGLGVFAHEYGHDLGLPDNYDTSGGDNGTGFWDLMSVGSYLGPGVEDLGARPGDMTAWDKFQLGWLNYEISSWDVRSTHRLGPAEFNTRDAQGLFTLLPDKTVATVLADPPQGEWAWYSGRGNELDNRMTRSLTLPAGTTSLSMSLWYDIETNWDYFYVSLSLDNGATWSNLAGNRTTSTNPNNQNFGNGITGTSGPGFVPATFAVPMAFVGPPVLLRLRYWTDLFVQGKGVLVDEIVAGTFTDGAEATPNGWDLGGWARSSGVETSTHFNAYLSEYRQYRSYDIGLHTGPYNFGFTNTLPNWVEHYPYQDGLLIHYWDTSQTDNDTSVHPGEGLILPVDSHPVPLLRISATAITPWSGRVQSHDATFSLDPTEPLTLHRLGVLYSYPAQGAVSVFDDRLEYWSPQAPQNSVRVPRTGTVIEVHNTAVHDSVMRVRVGPGK